MLKKAGVVDAGGQGLCMIFDGMMRVFKYGEIVETEMSEEEKAAETAEFFRSVAAEFDSEINFTYCTEFIIGRDPEITTDPNELRLFLETIGDCVVVVTMRRSSRCTCTPSSPATRSPARCSSARCSP